MELDSEISGERVLTHLDLFSGIGGFSLAAEWAGFKTVCFVEIEPFCQKALRKRRSGVPIWSDINSFNGVRYRGKINIITGGFPCPAFSRAGREGGFEQDPLFYEMIRSVNDVRPDWVIFENVDGFRKWNEELRTEVKNIGYEFCDFTSDAKDYGIAQARKRYFAVCVRRGVLLSPQHLRRVQGEQSKSVHGLQPYYPDTEGRWASTIETKEEWRAIFADSYRSGDTNGIPDRMDRLRALGNAVVPAQVYPILKAIADTYDGYGVPR